MTPAEPLFDGAFDARFYAEQNADLPLAQRTYDHFMAVGWKELRDPSAGFNLWWYWVMHLEGDPQAENPFEHFQRVGHSLGLSTWPPAGALSVEKQRTFSLKSMALLEAGGFGAAALSRLAYSLVRLRQLPLADLVVCRAIRLAPSCGDLFTQLGDVLVARGVWWRAREAYEQAIALGATGFSTWAGLGESLERLERWSEAAVAYRRAAALDDSAPHVFYRLGNCEKALGHLDSALCAYGRALTVSEPRIRACGVGALHEQAGDWALAAEAYGEDAKQESSPAHYVKQAQMLDRCYRWEEAAAACERALEVAPSHPEARFQFARVQERLEKYAEAAGQYRAALKYGFQDVSYCFFRMGYSLWRAGSFSEACQAWLRIGMTLTEPARDEPGLPDVLEEIAANRHDADLYRRAARLYARQGDLSDALRMYQEAAARSHDHVPEDYYHIGKLLFEQGRCREACEALSEIYSLTRQGQGEGVNQRYAEYLATLAVRQNVVLYESFHGASVSCNPLALFRFLYADSSRGEWLHVWVLKAGVSIPPWALAMPRVIFVRHGSDLYLRYLAVAGVLINNNSFMPYFVRRPEQRYLNTWHGTPWKTLGADIVGAVFDHKNMARNLLQATHVIYPNEHTLKVLLESHQVRELYSGQLCASGYPRVDMMLAADAERRKMLRSALGIDDGLPIVLYAPTWRGALATPTFDAVQLVETLAALRCSGANVVFSGHHMVEGRVDLGQLGVFVLPASIDTTEFLSVVDVLVTDYSSVLFDFLPTRKPIVLYAYDIDAYRKERGLYFPATELPVALCHTCEGLAEALRSALHSNAAHPGLEHAIDVFCPFEDGLATARVVDFLFDGVGGYSLARDNDVKRLLIYPGNFDPNGITAALLALVSWLDTRQFSVTLAIDPWDLESYPQRMERFSQLPDVGAVLGRIGLPVASDEELHLDALFQRQQGDVVPRARTLLANMYAREFKRLYGNVDFDAVIDYSGYAYFWTALFSLGRPPAMRSFIWLHSDMNAEALQRAPFLRSAFALLQGFDRLVSVSEAVGQENQAQLADRYAVSPHKFVSMPNLISPRLLGGAALESLGPSVEAVAFGSPLVGCVARLSPEKGLDRLVDAFARFQARFPGAQLLIVGQGPCREGLERQIRELGLQEKAILVGYLSNPYPLMRQMQIFVLPSLYEGQGIVLLEALALGCRVIATDSPGTSEALRGTGGLIVESSVEGIYQGLVACGSALPSAPHFDAENYCRRSLVRFNELFATG